MLTNPGERAAGDDESSKRPAATSRAGGQLRQVDMRTKREHAAPTTTGGRSSDQHGQPRMGLQHSETRVGATGAKETGGGRKRGLK